MKPFLRHLFLILMCILSTNTFAQEYITNMKTIKNSDFNVTNDVVQLQEYVFKKVYTLNFDEPPATEEENKLVFYKGYLNQSHKNKFLFGNRENHLTYNTTYTYSNNHKSFSMAYKLKSKFNKEFQIKAKQYVFSGLEFYFPIDSKIEKETKRALKVIYNINNKQHTETFKLENNFILRTISYETSKIVFTYSKNGSLVKKSNGYIDTYYAYNKDKLCIEEKNLGVGNGINDTYYYQKDAKGNWIKKVQVWYDKRVKSVGYTARKLTYNEGTTVGSTAYDSIFIKKALNSITNSEKELNKKISCISGDCQNGFGKIKYNTGDTYEGNFKNEERNGKGTYIYANRSKYEGDWLNNKQHGKGIYIDVFGGEYEGTFKNGHLNGTGTYTGEESVYKGYFVGSKMDGEGAYTDKKSGITYKGTFIKGVLTGFTKAYFQEKLIYEGNMKSFAFDGEGTLYDYKNGKKIVNLYKEGKLIKTISTSNLSQASDNSNSTSIGITWKKSEANSYWLYHDGVLKNGGKSFWEGNNLYVFMTQEAKIYLLKNYKTAATNTTYKATLLPATYPNGVWYKTPSNSFYAYNSKGLQLTNLEINKYAANGVDVLIKSKDQTETFLLRNFKNAEINKVFPAEIYSPTQSISTKAVTGFQIEINACKQLANPALSACIVNTFFEDYPALKKPGVNNTSFEQKIISSLNLIGRFNIESLFDVLSEIDKEESYKLSQKLDTDVKSKLKVYLKKVRNNYAKTHTNMVPKSLQKSVKKNN